MGKIEKIKLVLGEEKKFYLLTIVYSLALGMLSLALPISIQTLINTVNVGGLHKQLFIICVFLFGILAFSACLKVSQLVILEYFQRHFFARITSKMAIRLVNANFEVLGTKYRDDLTKRFFEIMTVQKSVVALLMGGLEVVLQLIVGLSLLVFYHPYFLVFNAFLILTIYLIWRLYGPSALNTAVEESKSKYKVVEWLDILFKNNILFKTTKNKIYAFNEVEKRIQDYTEKRKKHFYYLISQSAFFLSIYALMSSIVLGLGGYLVNLGQLSLGQLVASELIISLVLTSLAKSGKYLETFYDLFASVDKLEIFESIPIERVSTLSAENLNRPVLNLSGVQVGREGNRILFNQLFEFEKKYFIKIKNFSSFTILKQILQGVRHPEVGDIKINDISLFDYNVQDFRDQLIVCDKGIVFEDSVKNNLTYGLDEISPSEIYKVLKLVGLENVVTNLDEKLETILSPGGHTFSENQLVLLELARAILRKPKILIIHSTMDQLEEPQRLSIVKNILDLKDTTVIYFSILEAVDGFDHYCSISEKGLEDE